MAVVCLSMGHKFPWSVDIFLMERSIPFGCVHLLRAWSPPLCTWWQQALGALLSLCAPSCTHPSLPLRFMLFWKTFSFFLRKERRAGSLLAASAGIHWAPLLKCIHVSNSSKLTQKGLQLWWTSRRTDISMVMALSWAVLVLNHKFLRSLMSLVLSCCAGTALPLLAVVVV